jgi:hypothetical protein
MNNDDLRYPVGKFQRPGEFDAAQFQSFVSNIEQFPALVLQEVDSLTPEQLDWIYRPGGWTIKQVVHHCADSHMNAFIRTKLALTEDQPTIKPFLEAEWAKQVDYDVPIIQSIKILEGIHLRWSVLLKSLEEEQLHRSFLHPENGKEWSLYFTIALYSWHCRHHLGHVKAAKKYKGRF